ncbi:heterokaryon incompatibility protein-domain-containing protein [Hypoxylon trugodes]|uniref:heterokaryon incompatibility protein-domain-containing protein n=1 Tax=Hypoxylon trugodes TaxID=326681 RepID=UPI0021962802|nr:heterokaryon incompatibility protein-domain-containing protein [Hypoxylon trugodes]KAI1389582.1 heterokaryon incompatibility protein-domain-containing protein [Hypoxylon trugodes]
MFDDTREVSHGRQEPAIGQSDFRLSGNVERILRNPTNRDHARRWANNLRFLTFDDSDGIGSGGDCTSLTSVQNEKSPLRGQCQPCSKRVPVPSGHMCESHLLKKTPDRELELHKYDDPCIHVREHSCDDCQHIPLFPNEGKVTKFRIRRLYSSEIADAVRCDDFVAVSYCWSNEKGNDGTTRHQVIEEDGRVRDARASNATIDRTVAFARENGFRMIWIDQECIEQDNSEEKELAVQAMDYVYLRAHTSIGLFRAQLQHKHLECISLAYESQMSRFQKRRGRRPLRGCLKVNIMVMCEAVSMIINDRWNTRAWILQEAFASSGNMVLLFPRADNVNVPSWLLICHELSQSELAMQLDTVQSCLRICAPMIQPMVSSILYTKENGARKYGAGREKRFKDQNALGNADEIRETVKRINFFHPVSPTQSGKLWINNSKPRRTCNAAMALTYLQMRDLERVADKLAIVANICNYDFRVNTSELDKTESRLGPCIMALALANGDFSLLVPQMYRTPEDIKFPSHDDSEFSWLHNLAQNLQHAQSTDWNPFGPTSGSNNVSVVPLSEKGLSFAGFLWAVDRFLDLASLQVKYGESWRGLRKAKGLSQPPQRTKHLATTHLLFETIQHLVSIGEKSVANSIFNSTSNWRWNSRDNFLQSDVIESVDQFPSGLQVENRKGMFALDPSPDGWYHQCWLIDRVMDKGGFWVGHETEDNSFDTVDEAATDPKTGAVVHQVEDDHEISMRDKHDSNDSKMLIEDGKTYAPNDGVSDPNAQATGDHKREYLSEDGHSKKMRVYSVLAMMSDLVMEQDVTATKPTEGISKWSNINPQSMALFALLANQETSKKEETYNRQAIFDLDGNSERRVFVLIPLQMTLESIPRPAMRSKSVSWIVENPNEVTLDNDKQKSTGAPRRFRVKGMTKGMWEFMINPSGRYEIS